MKTDIQIAQGAKILNIKNIVTKLNLLEDDYDQYGKYKAKLNLDILKKNKNKKDGKLILVTAITPTPAGEGKSTVTVGLTQALNKIGGPFTEEDEGRIQAFTAQISVGLENAKMFNDMQAVKNYNEAMLQSMSNGVITVDETGTLKKFK